MFYRIVLLCIPLILSLTSCSKTTVVLLPDPHGSVGKVYVQPKSAAGAGTLLEQANESTSVSKYSSAKPKTEVIDPKELPEDLKKTLESEPEYLLKYRFYFHSDSIALNDNSKNKIELAIETINKRESCDIVSIGHTDSVGESEYNRKLSKKRAETIKDMLVRKGVRPECIRTVSYGELDPLVATKDNVAEGVNRRVELEIR